MVGSQDRCSRFGNHLLGGTRTTRRRIATRTSGPTRRAAAITTSGGIAAGSRRPTSGRRRRAAGTGGTAARSRCASRGATAARPRSTRGRTATSTARAEAEADGQGRRRIPLWVAVVGVLAGTGSSARLGARRGIRCDLGQMVDVWLPGDERRVVAPGHVDATNVDLRICLMKDVDLTEGCLHQVDREWRVADLGHFRLPLAQGVAVEFSQSLPLRGAHVRIALRDRATPGDSSWRRARSRRSTTTAGTCEGRCRCTRS